MFKKIIGFGGLVLGLVFITGVLLSIRFDIEPQPLEQIYATQGSHFVEVDGVRMHYRDVGDGPILLLIHGQSANLFTWQGWEQQLSAEFRVISLDLPGHGLSSADPKMRYDWPGLAELVDRFVVKLDLEHFNLSGNSLGGAIAIRYSLDHAEKVDKLILISSIGYLPEEPAALIFRLMAMPVVGNLLNSVTTELFIRSGLELAYGDPRKLTDEVVDRYRLLTLRMGNRTESRKILQNSVKEGTFAALAEQVENVNVPTLILWGDKDGFALPKYAKWFDDKLPNSELRMFAGVGHMAMEEAPFETAQAAAEFLTGESFMLEAE